MRYPEFHYRWEWQLESAPEALWQLAADTNRFNRETGVPVVEERATVGDEPTNGRRELKLKRFGVPVEWEEEPFEWLRPSRFGVMRRYTRGPVAEMRVLCELNAAPRGGTRLVYQVWAAPRNLIGILAIPVQIGFLSARRFAHAFHEYDRLAAQSQFAPPLSPQVQLAPGGAVRLAELRQALLNQGLSPDLVTRLLEAVEHADDLSLARMRPYHLADQWNAPRRDVLDLFLWATRVGLLNFQWDLLCPLCRGAKATTPTLREIEPQVHCDVCRIDFTANFERSVELTFHPNPSVRVVDDRPFCVGGPQVTPHIVAQQLLPAHSQRTLELPLEVGHHRVRALALPGAERLTVSLDGPNELGLRASDEGWSAEEREVGTLPRLQLENATDREQLLILERTAWSDQAVTAADVTTRQAFRDLFSSEALRPGEQITVGTLTIVFTDLRDSTQLYRAIGDAPAFGRVMNHFDVLRDAIAAEEGAIVKTIGDAVMAVFRRPIAALRAMLRAGETLRAAREGTTPLVLKVGIHAGPCIAVNLNDRLDYFGSTVNIAARIQNLSVGDDVVISAAVQNDPEVRAWLAEHDQSIRVEAFSAPLKGLEGSFELWRVRAQ